MDPQTQVNPTQTTGVMDAPPEDDSLLTFLDAQVATSRDAASYHARELERHRRIVRAGLRAVVELADVGDADAGLDAIEENTRQESIARAQPMPQDKPVG